MIQRELKGGNGGSSSMYILGKFSRQGAVQSKAFLILGKPLRTARISPSRASPEISFNSTFVFKKIFSPATGAGACRRLSDIFQELTVSFQSPASFPAVTDVSSVVVLSPIGLFLVAHFISDVKRESCAGLKEGRETTGLKEERGTRRRYDRLYLNPTRVGPNGK
ncbi:hypothetical protein Vadar_027272 [Vaccinium darrowii]|uniref:Uncharacterized protein n=1 Tax=Vaccinium darrowii TaxID=229202 RepID=A0ACB7YPU0_9ERIC|nr:hypothetical protein Vadar_027272 [Vaccinium darrowii]